MASEKAIRYSRFADIDGEVHEVEVLFIKKAKLKAEKAGGRHGKKGSSYGKSQMERVQMNIEQFLDEQCDWDSIYFEIIDQNCKWALGVLFSGVLVLKKNSLEMESLYIYIRRST